VAVADDTTDAFGLLLCGAGESGKTTFTRQLKLRFLQHGISDSDRHSFIATMRGNLIETMQELLRWAEANDVDISEDISESSHLVSRTNAFNCEFNSELWDALDQLWEDPGVQVAFEHKDETVIPDHMDYFFGKLNDLRDDDYVPTDEDILRARIRSIGIDSVTFNLEGALIRVMPNAPLMVGAGMSAVCVAADTSRAEGELVRELFSLMGDAVLLDEALMNAATAISGSGPAYFALLAEELARAGERAGLAPEDALLLATQTLRGTARYLELTEAGPAQLRVAVTSPGGTTQAALETFEAQDFSGLVAQAVSAALRRAEELA
jgi:hypothetical protein